MSENELTPALLRADAARAVYLMRVAAQRVESPLMPDDTTRYDEADCDGMCLADDLRNAAAALEEQAQRLEQGERLEALVRQMRSHVCCIEDGGFIGEEEVILNNRREADRLVLAIVEACGGRVALGDEEGGR
jgi:hypothetical protein